MSNAHSVYNIIVLIILQISHKFVNGQDYEVTEIQCTFASGSPTSTSTARDSIVAKLRKPDGFKGSPLFADDRGVNPETDPQCQIRPERTDPTGLRYSLRITDFGRCGVLKRNGFVHVRVWFPQFPGVVMQSDQELIIMCKPPEPTVIENKAAGFAGSFPHGARVSGVVEETPGRLEYEVALYKEAPAARLSIANSTSAMTAASTLMGQHAKQPPGELPVDQAVPIGTKLQLRARISPDSAWKYVKLMEVTVSPDPDDPHSAGSVALVKDGCRNRDFASIIPHQPARYRERHNEVFLDFEAFLLSSMRERSTLWIHSQIKACMEQSDCQPDFCLDLFEPSGHGRRRRRELIENGNALNAEALTKRYHNGRGAEYDSNSTAPVRRHQEEYYEDDHDRQQQFTRFKENIEYTVLMPGDFYRGSGAVGALVEASCGTFLAVSGVLGALLFLSALAMCWLAAKLHQAIVGGGPGGKGALSIDQLVREASSRRYANSQGIPADVSSSASGYTGRATTQ